MEEQAVQPQPAAQPEPAAPVEQKTSAAAATSLILGILSYLLCSFGFLASIPAIVCGHIGVSKINAAPDRLKGKGMAIGGLVLGYINIVVALLLLLVAVPAFIKAREQTPKFACGMNLVQIQQAKEQYALENGGDDPVVLTPENLDTYITGGFANLKCPAGGEYQINALSENPTCSVHGDLIEEGFGDRSTYNSY
jgi:competence protein ComGC